ncbi:hypothetical protein AAVH_05830, partial [Aphelenchoides avenae]
MNVLFQWVDGGILRQFQVQKNTDRYRILMAVVNEVQQSALNEEQSGRIATNDGVDPPVDALRHSTPVKELDARESVKQPAGPDHRLAQAQTPVRINDNKKKTDRQTRITSADVDRTIAAALSPAGTRRRHTIRCRMPLSKNKSLKRNASSVSTKEGGSKIKMTRNEDVKKETNGIVAQQGYAVPAVNG